MGALKELTRAIDLLADSVFGLTTELALLRKDRAEGRPFHFDAKKCAVDGSDPKVQEALGIKPKSTRWSDVEEHILVEGYAMHMTPEMISRELARNGYYRSAKKCVGHMYDIRKRTRK